MATIELRTDTGEPIGYLLFAGPGGKLEPGEYDCVFIFLPIEENLRSDLRGRFILDHGKREFRAIVTRAAGGISVRVNLRTGWTLALKGAEGRMLWQAQHGNGRLTGSAIEVSQK
ncbi:conserved hypothetical protein [Hyphomicrobiales bacterium]|nr:conserved hypothetical protein [Hyphomicrobiales bacterium]CAH1665692.1 conserved hypothetical protein [Hyphomicrobiales bacterium]